MKKPFPLILLASPLIFSLELVFLKWAFSAGKIDPVTFTANRSLLAVLLLAAFFGRSLLASVRKNPATLLKWAAILGGLRVFADLFYFIAQSRTTPTAFTLLSQLSTFATAALAYVFLRERMSAREFLGGLVMLAGAAMIILSGGGFSISSGSVLILGFVLFVSSGNIASKKGFSEGAERNALLLSSVAVATAGFYVLEPLFFGVNPIRTFSSEFPYALGGAAFFVANVSLIFYCIEKFGPSRMQFAGVTNVLFSALFSFVFLGLVPSAGQLLGGAVIVGGVLVFLGIFNHKIFNPGATPR
ncbi:MAG: DMT family transporter [archaeon]